MGEILKMNTIHDYHEFLGVKTLHPLVSVIDLSELEAAGRRPCIRLRCRLCHKILP